MVQLRARICELDLIGSDKVNTAISDNTDQQFLSYAIGALRITSFTLLRVDKNLFQLIALVYINYTSYSSMCRLIHVGIIMEYTQNPCLIRNLLYNVMEGKGKMYIPD